MNFTKIAAVFSLVLSSLAGADEVLVNNKPYKVSELLKLDKDVEDFKRVEKKLAKSYYGPVYMTMFETEKAVEQNAKVDKGGLDEHQKKFAAQGAVLGFGAAKGLSVTGFDIAKLAVSFLFSGVEDEAIRMSAQMLYERTIDGSITVTKWYPGTEVTAALADGYGQLISLLEQDCNFEPSSKGKMWRGRTYYANITGKCGTNKARPIVLSRNSEAFKYWEDGAGQGSIVMYTFPAMGRSQDDMRAFGATVRQTLSKDWYVMQAETLTNQQTGQPEKMYLISKDGAMKAYPLPPAPVFK